MLKQFAGYSAKALPTSAFFNGMPNDSALNKISQGQIAGKMAKERRLGGKWKDN
jgi:hypothetical protein